MRRLSDDLFSRMEMLEGIGTNPEIVPSFPVCARLHGIPFKRRKRRSDAEAGDRFSRAMRETCSYLVERSQAVIGYVYSDEISLIWPANDAGSLVFGGKVHIINSLLASMAAVKFDRVFGSDQPPYFDCRVWQAPSQKSAADVILWRTLLARNKSLKKAVRALYSDEDVLGKDRAEQLEMLAAKGVLYEDERFEKERHGTFFRRVCENDQSNTANSAESANSHQLGSDLADGSSVVEVDTSFFGHLPDREAFIFNPQKGHLT